MNGQRAEDQPIEEGETPTGGIEITEEQLDADNAVEEDTIKTVEPDNPTS